MTDELYHSGRKGMKWYQHIFGDEAQQRRRAKRMKKNADKVARIKEKIRIAEESNKLKQMKADAKKKLKETKGETSKIKKLKKEDIKKQIEEKKAETEKAKKTTGPVAPQTSARAIARSMGGMSDEEVKKHLQRLTAEKSIRQLAAEEAERAKNPIQKYIKNTLNNALGNATNAMVSYGTKKATDFAIGFIESKMGGGQPEIYEKANDKIKKANERARGADRMKDYVSPFGKDVAVDEGYSLDNRNSSSSVDKIIDLASAISGNKNTGAAVKAVVDAVKTVPVSEAKQMFALPPPTAKSERERPRVIYL